jgi:glycosyltransferase involved in cell wall biosynthesis
MSLPKVLILGQPFNNNSGGGITQANLFGGWDKDKIAVVSTMHMFNSLNTDICDTYYILGDKEYKWMSPLNLLQRKVVSGVRKVKKSVAGKLPVKSGTTLRTSVVDKFLYPLLEYIGLLHKASELKLSAELCKWIDEYNPDVIYAQASTRETVLFCSQVKEHARKPMIYHVMDDWPSTISQRGPFQKYWHKKIDKEFRLLLNRADVLMSISHGMAKEYKNRYNKDFITFHNPIELDFWKSHQRTSYELASPAVVLYAGRIGIGIDQTLESMAQAIEVLNKEIEPPVCFALQTKDKPSWMGKYKCVRHNAMVPYNDLPKVFAAADFLYLPYDFSKESIRFIKYSMPTKAPEYMMSGTPVIVFGPGETSLVQDALQNGWAKVVTENNITLLAEAVKELVADAGLRRQTAGNAIRLAETNFNSVKIRNDFRNIMYSLTTKQPIKKAV